ncbi:hypothetical protein BpHYR1_031680 [Brachionus plicatilis]|uniref:Uncharacterized protein n=1 Tax=Brachionus plicatilis TaxID=10195 RepID=A0A3M7PRR4_BRAPC|nr:hypothetical protein BpHYR1_031680 [Brachionus plicatilis]
MSEVTHNRKMFNTKIFLNQDLAFEMKFFCSVDLKFFAQKVPFNRFIPSKTKFNLYNQSRSQIFSF